MMKLLLALVLVASLGFGYCGDYVERAVSSEQLCDFEEVVLSRPNVYKCFEAGKEHLDAGRCFDSAGEDGSEHYTLALFYLESSVPRLSSEGDFVYKARAHELAAEAHYELGDLEGARKAYSLAVIDYERSDAWDDVVRVAGVLEALGVRVPADKDSGIVIDFSFAEDVGYFLVLFAGFAVLALFLLVVLGRKPYRPRKQKVVVREEPKRLPRERVSSSSERTPEPVKKEKPNPKERAKEKLRRKYGGRS